MIRYRAIMALLGIAIFVVSWPISQGLQFDRSITAMFASDDPTLLDYQMLQQAFGGNAVVMLVYEDEQLMSSEGIDRSAAISQLAVDIPGVEGVLSPAALSDAVARIRPGGFFRSASDVPALARSDDVVARGIDWLFAGYTHSKDHRLVAVVAMLDPDHPPATILSLQELAESLPEKFAGQVGTCVLVGEPVLIHDAFNLVQRDGRRLTTITLFLLSIVVLVSLLDFRFVLLTALVVAWSIVVTEALVVTLGIDRSLVSTVMTAIVTVISVAAVLHLGVKFQRARNRGLAIRAACNHSLSLLMVPIFWTCMTDAAGFAALGASRILPVRQFGGMIAIASIAVFVATILFAATFMMMPELRFPLSLRRVQQRLNRSLRRRCLRLARWFVAYRRTTLVASLVALVISTIGTWNAEPETSFLNNFRKASPIVNAYARVEQELGGAGVWDIVLPAPQDLTSNYMRQVLVLEKRLREIDVNGAKLTKVLSMADADYIVGKATLLKFAPPEVRLSGMRLTLPHFVDALLTPSGVAPKRLRIMLRSEEQLPAERKTQLIAAVELAVQEHTATEQWMAAVDDANSELPKVTGYYVMMSRLVAQLVEDQWRCLAVAALLVWILLWLATRSLRLAIAAMLPNLFPAMFVLAVTGFLGGKINMGATMIAAVSIGLTIDGSVHLLSTYRRCRRRGHGVDRCAVHAASSVGVPIMLATLALIFGFSVMATSGFVPTATFGTLVAATLFLGTLVNLTLLPACIAMLDRPVAKHYQIEDQP